jgi:tRNA(fMet)-specific endonuclease VapC
LPLPIGQLAGWLLQQGRPASRIDLMIASVALVHDFTLVTHNTADFQGIPSLRVEDWLQP